MNPLERLGAVFVALLIIIPAAFMQALFLLLGWWLCHDFLNLPMLGFWQSWGLCLVANTLIKSQLSTK